VPYLFNDCVAIVKVGWYDPQQWQRRAVSPTGDETARRALTFAREQS
jgi:hypothetical protein